MSRTSTTSPQSRQCPDESGGGSKKPGPDQNRMRPKDRLQAIRAGTYKVTRLEDIYVSVDIEADGPCPGIHSMLSLGAAAFTIERELLGTFSRNFELIPEGKPDPATMQQFWDRFPAAYEATRVDAMDPKVAMQDLDNWIQPFQKQGRPIFMGYPARFDLRWVDYYSWRYINKKLLGLGAFDLKTAGAIAMRTEYHVSRKANFPKSWFTSKKKHTHIASDDAVEQGEMGINLIREVYGFDPLK